MIALFEFGCSFLFRIYDLMCLMILLIRVNSLYDLRSNYQLFYLRRLLHIFNRFSIILVVCCLVSSFTLPVVLQNPSFSPFC